MHTEDIIPTLLTSNIYIRIFLLTALTLTGLRLYEIFKLLLIGRINTSVGFQGMLNFPRIRDSFLYQLARGILLKDGILYPLQSKVRTPPPHLRPTILGWQLTLNV